MSRERNIIIFLRRGKRMISIVLLFALGLILLIKGGDWFVDGATGIAKRFGVPELIIGATIVSIGTTLPEVMVSATSAISGHGEIAYGNAIGSIICNTSLICALSVAIKPTEVSKEPLKVPTIFFFVSAFFYSLVAYIFGYFARWVGIVLLLTFLLYMFISVRDAKKMPKIKLTKEEKEAELNPLWKDILLLVVGAIVIAFGADLLVDNGTLLAKALGVPEAVIGLTLVALGTSLPELVTAITSLVKGHGALSLGNIIGANLFNLVWVSGLSTALRPFTIPEDSTIGGYNTSLVLDIPLMFVVMAILTLPTLKSGKLKRWQGIVLLVLYCAFCSIQFSI